MYLSYYSMRQEPFPNNPSPELFFDSPIHVAAWNVLRDTLESEEPYFLLTGDYGTGKTLLCLKVVEALKAEGVQAYVHLSTPIQSYWELLWRLATALSLEAVSESDGEEVLHRRICHYFETHPEQSLVILLDEAQEYDPKTLNRIRLLTNYAQAGNFPIRLFLFAHSAFSHQLKSPDLEPLDQRIKRRFHLTGLNLVETKEYIYFRLLKSGAQGSPCFTDEGIERLWELTKGVPRRVNNVCDMSLLIGMSRGAQTIAVPLVEEAAEYLGCSLSPSEGGHAVTEPSVTLPARTDQREAPAEASRDGGSVWARMDNRKRPGSLSEIVRSDGSNKNQPQKAPGHYVVVGEMPVESFSATPSAVSVGHDAAPGSEGRRKAGISTWMWRLAVALLLVAILGRLVWEYLPGLSEWLSHETKNLP